MPSITSPDLAFPQSVLRRLSNWKYYAQGDLLSRLLQEGTLFQSVKNLLALEERFLDKEKAPARLPLTTLIAKSYHFLLDYFLNKK